MKLLKTLSHSELYQMSATECCQKTAQYLVLCQQLHENFKADWIVATAVTSSKFSLKAEGSQLDC